jgi:parvulin-like peptidyl-prolyl isomerase
MLFAPAASTGEIVEEIIAKVNGDIITKTDYDKQAEVLLEEAYRELTGAELDAYLEQMRKNLLLSMIDRKILVDQAQRIYDLDVMGDVFIEQFKQEQNISNDLELEQLLGQEDMSIAQLKQRLIEMSAPDEVIRFEVRSRISVSGAEVETFYQENKDNLMQPAVVTLREIVVLAPEGSNRSERLALAEAARRRVVDGEDFAEVAEELSEAGTAAEGGLLGEMKQGDLAKHLAGPAFELPVGSVTEVIETSYGFHILKIEEREAKHATPLADVHDRIHDLLEQNKYSTELDAYLVKVRSESEWCVKQKFQEQLRMANVNPCEEI